MLLERMVLVVLWCACGSVHEYVLQNFSEVIAA